jgi:hypothetical protein
MEITDIQLDKSNEPSFEPPRRYPWLWAGVGIALVLTGVGYMVMSRRDATSDRVRVTDVAPVPDDAPPAKPLGEGAAELDLPPLDQTDPIVRELVRGISSHPTIVTWLTSDNLLRSFVAATNNVAASRSPVAQVRHLTPSGPFSTVQRGGETVIDSRSYQRYDRIGDAVHALDAAAVARLYGSLKPRINQAHEELGTGQTFDEMLERAIIVLLQTPVVEGPVRVHVKSVAYEYSDERLEGLAPAQKHLVRMGPRNTRLIQAKLREIATALGVDEQRLPAVSPS